MSDGGLFSASGQEIAIWLAVTLALGGPAAAASGRALALGWRAFGVAFIYAAMLAAATDFLCYALFQVSTLPIFAAAERIAAGEIFAAAALLAGFAATFAILLAFAYAGWRIARARRMSAQYPFLTEA